jgi:small subunit ribosomal protein S2
MKTEGKTPEEEKLPTGEAKKDEFNLNVEEMAKAGLHFGHKTSRSHPKMEPYLYGARNAIHLIDLEKSKEKLSQALEFVKNLISENKILLVIGTKIQSRELVKNFVKDCNLPYINERWLGGTFTNFGVMKKRIDYFKDLEKKKAGGEFEKYTKKERAEIEKEIKNLERKFGGIKNLEKLPDAIFVLDMEKDNLAVKEAKKKGVKVIGISDTNVDPTLADYPIPASDDAVSSIQYILEKFKEVILKAKPK